MVHRPSREAKQLMFPSYERTSSSYESTCLGILLYRFLFISKWVCTPRCAVAHAINRTKRTKWTIGTSLTLGEFDDEEVTSMSGRMATIQQRPSNEPFTLKEKKCKRMLDVGRDQRAHHERDTEPDWLDDGTSMHLEMLANPRRPSSVSFCLSACVPPIDLWMCLEQARWDFNVGTSKYFFVQQLPSLRSPMDASATSSRKC